MANEIYRDLLVKEQVVVTVPNSGDHMKQVGPYANGLIPKHWKHGMQIPPGVIINRHFYGLEINDLGKKIVAKVIIKEKTTSCGKKYVLIDSHKTSKKVGLIDLKFAIETEKEIEEGVPIPGTRSTISFKKRSAPFTT